MVLPLPPPRLTHPIPNIPAPTPNGIPWYLVDWARMSSRMQSIRISIDIPCDWDYIFECIDKGKKTDKGLKRELLKVKQYQEYLQRQEEGIKRMQKERAEKGEDWMRHIIEGMARDSTKQP